MIPFEASVIFWKTLGTFTWCFALQLLCFLVVDTICVVSGTGFNLSMQIIFVLATFAEILAYFFNLNPVFLPFDVLSLTKALFRLIWILVTFVWLSILAYSFYDEVTSVLMACVITILYAISERFTLTMNYDRSSRFSRLGRAFRFHFISATFVAIGLLLLGGSFGHVIGVFAMFMMANIVLAVTSVIFGEPLSFSSSDNQRLIHYLGDKGYWQYLAFHSFYSLSSGNPHSRAFILNDASTIILRGIVDRCSAVIKMYGKGVENLGHLYQSSSRGLHDIHSVQYRENVHLTVSQQENFLQKTERNRRDKGAQRRAEADILELAPLVSLGVEGLAMLLQCTPEDKKGVIQSQAKNIALAIARLKISLDGARIEWAIAGAPRIFGDNKARVNWANGIVQRIVPKTMLD